MSDVLSERNGVRARKKHRCVFCGSPIAVGSLYDVRTGVDSGTMWTMKMHPECHAYEQAPGVVDPDWYEDVSEPVFSFTEACLYAKSPFSKLIP
jgi:hypothetical protein